MPPKKARKLKPVTSLSPDTLEELTLALGEHARVNATTAFDQTPIPLAQALFNVGTSWAHYASVAPPITSPDVQAELRGLRDAVVALLSRYNSLQWSARLAIQHHHARDADRVAIAASLGYSADLHENGRLAMRANRAFGVLLEELIGTPSHRPVDHQRRTFAVMVARTLQTAGIAPTTSKGGLFSRVMEILLRRVSEARGENKKGDPERLVSYATTVLAAEANEAKAPSES